jgi:hypothetical protein
MILEKGELFMKSIKRKAKLVLNKKTVSNLSRSDLQAAQGGIEESDYPFACSPLELPSEYFRSQCFPCINTVAPRSYTC